MADAAQGTGTTAGAGTTTATPAPGAGAATTGITPNPGNDGAENTGDKGAANDQETKFGQKDVDRIVAKERRRLEREVERRVTDRVRAELAEKQLREGGGRGEGNTDQAKGKPQRKNFEHAEDFVEALAEWKIEERELKRGDEHKSQRSQHDAAEYNRRLMDACTRGSDELGVDDFEEVALDEDLPVTDAMAHAIAESEIPAKVLYHLGQNPAEAKRISKLKSTHQVRAIAEIESKLKAVPKTNTPAPIVPNDAQGASHQDPSSLKSGDDWLKWRERDLKEKGRR